MPGLPPHRLTDASNVLLMEHWYGLNALTTAERHFRVLRGPGGLPFRLLPADATPTPARFSESPSFRPRVSGPRTASRSPHSVTRPRVDFPPEAPRALRDGLAHPFWTRTTPGTPPAPQEASGEEVHVGGFASSIAHPFPPMPHRIMGSMMTVFTAYCVPLLWVFTGNSDQGKLC